MIYFIFRFVERSSIFTVVLGTTPNSAKILSCILPTTMLVNLILLILFIFSHFHLGYK